MAQSRSTASRILIWSALALVVLGATWRYAIRDHVIPRNFGVVEPGHIYRSGRLTPAATRDVVQQHGIRTIIDLGAYEQGPPQSPDEVVAERTAAALGVTRYRFELEGDGTGNPNAYVAALRVIANPENHPVLIHCSAGAQRTSACVVLYRHHMQGKSIESVYPEAFDFKHDPGDNWKLMAYLADWSDDIGHALRSNTWVSQFDPVPVEPAAPTPAAPAAADAR